MKTVIEVTDKEARELFRQMCSKLNYRCEYVAAGNYAKALEASYEFLGLLKAVKTIGLYNRWIDHVRSRMWVSGKILPGYDGNEEKLLTVG